MGARFAWGVLPWLLCVAGTARAQDEMSAGDGTADIRTLDAVVATAGGPAVWELRRGDKTLWILGSLQPVPEGLALASGGIEGRVARAGAVLGPQGLVVGDNIGLFRGLTLWPSIRRVRFNPDERTLREVVDPALYARWLEAKARYLGDDEGVEKLRPMYAAYELYRAAAHKAGLGAEDPVNPLVARVAGRGDVPLYEAKLRLAIEDPRKAVRQFDVPRADDVACLQQTLDRLDGFVQSQPALAEAWAVGDMARYAELQPRQALAGCWARLTNEAIARQQGIADLTVRIRGTWLRALDRALDGHDVVFATLPMRDLLDATGTLATLEDEGFRLVPQGAAGAEAGH